MVNAHDYELCKRRNILILKVFGGRCSTTGFFIGVINRELDIERKKDGL
jgi:hypothetical protein